MRRRDPRTVFFVIPILAAASAPSAFSRQSDPEKLIDAGHWKKARTLVEARIHQTPDDALANFLLSQVRNAFGDYNSPLPLAEKAVVLDGHVAKYHRQLAEVLGVEAQHAGPIKIVFLAHQFRSEIDTAISLDPRDLQAQRDLLEYYLVAPGIAGGDIQKAAATAEHIGVLDAAEGYRARARIASFRKQTAEMEAMLTKAVRTQPSNYRALTELAKFYLSADHANWEAAENAGRDLLKLDRGRVDGYVVLAQIYAQTSDWNALDETLAQASTENPDDLTPYFRAADALLGNGRDPARAARYLRTYLDRDPEGNEPSWADARRKLGLAEQAKERR